MGNAKGHCYRGGAWPLQVTTVASPSSSTANFHALGRWPSSTIRAQVKDVASSSPFIRVLLGYKLPLISLRPLVILSYTTQSNPEHSCIINGEVEALLRKGAVEEVRLSLGYYSKMFVVLKDGGWGPIINLKRLNTYLVPLHFWMDTPRNVALLLRPGNWTALIDLKDTYFHVPVDCRFHRLLRFGWQGKLYQYRVFPFGLCLASWVFTFLTTTLKKWLRARGVRVVFYLDDILVVGQSEAECAANLKMALKLLQEVSFITNWGKS